MFRSLISFFLAVNLFFNIEIMRDNSKDLLNLLSLEFYKIEKKIKYYDELSSAPW